MKKSDREMPSGCWNTFKAAIENRMLSIADDGSQRSGTIQTPNGPAFAHFTSSYWAEMDTIEELANKAFTSVSSSRELSAHLFHLLGGNSEQERAFEKLFSGLVEFASRSIFQKWSAFLADAVVSEAAQANTALQGTRRKRRAPELGR